MSTPRSPHHDALIAILARHDIQGSRVERAVDWELRSWTPEEMELLLAQMKPREKLGGNNDPCGPRFNLSTPLPLKMAVAFNLVRGLGIAFLFPLQLCAGLYLAWQRKWTAIRYELPRATTAVAGWLGDIMTFIKADYQLVQQALNEKKALCVNRDGQLRLCQTGYAVMSHVWAETYGWQTPTDWGAVSLQVRQKGMPLDHIRRCVDACHAEWIWLDHVAMPQILETMDEKTTERVERLRIETINQLPSIYGNADKVVIIDSALLRLHSASMIDAAAVLSVGFWMQRLWPLVECRLARKVILQTHAASFDLDAIIDRLNHTVSNPQHRYFPLLHRLTPLRPTPRGHERLIYSSSSSNRDHDSRLLLLEDVYWANEGRCTDVDVDGIRVLFPLLGLQWEYGWTLTDGVAHVIQRLSSSSSQEKEMLRKWCKYRDLKVSI